MHTTRTRFQTAIITVTEETKSWLRDEFKAILESNKDFTRKCDYIGYSIAHMDAQVVSLDEEIKELQTMKKKLITAKNITLSIGAEVFSEYGIEKIEGAGISSITLTKETSKVMQKLEILDDELLIAAGFYKKVLDEEAILQAYENQDQTVKQYSELIIEEISTPSKIKINKRRASNTIEDISLKEAS